jgi:hypothetical protein
LATAVLDQQQPPFASQNVDLVWSFGKMEVGGSAGRKEMNGEMEAEIADARIDTKLEINIGN